MGTTIAALLVLVGASALRDSPVDCPAAERHVAEVSRILQQESDKNRAYEVSEELQDFLIETESSDPRCVAERIVPLLVDLVENADMFVAYRAVGMLADLGEMAAPNLSALRRVLPRAKAADEAEVNARRTAGETVIIGGSFYEERVEELIRMIEFARDFPPRWQDGLCARLERRGTPELPEDLTVRIVSPPVDPGSCTAELFRPENTWTFSTARTAEADAFPPQVLESWRQLSRFSSTRITAWQICPVSSRPVMRAGVRLADMRLKWIDELEEENRYSVVLEAGNPSNSIVEEVAFDFDAGREIRAADVQNVECWITNTR